jgi:hypothetical protein
MRAGKEYDSLSRDKSDFYHPSLVWLEADVLALTWHLLSDLLISCLLGLDKIKFAYDVTLLGTVHCLWLLVGPSRVLTI